MVAGEVHLKCISKELRDELVATMQAWQDRLKKEGRADDAETVGMFLFTVQEADEC